MAGDAAVVVSAIPSPSLDEYKSVMLDRTDLVAESKRLPITTIHIQKEAEAIEYKGSLKIGPYLQAEIDITGELPAIVADRIWKKAVEAKLHNAKVEAHRLTLKKKIRDAQSKNEIVMAAREPWPTEV